MAIFLKLSENLIIMSFLLDTTGANLSDTQAVERLLRSTALAQDYQLPLAPHLAALSELLCKYYYFLFLFTMFYIQYIIIIIISISICYDSYGWMSSENKTSLKKL